MLIYLLLAIFIAMLYFSYLKFDKDIIAPSVVLVAGYTFSILCATANIEAWGIDLHWETIGILTYGTGLFVITGYFVKKIMERKYAKQETARSPLEPIDYNRSYVKYFCIFQILVMVAWVVNIYYVTSQIGDFNSFSEAMLAYAKWSSYGTEWMKNKAYFIVNQFMQITTISCYLAIYILAYNIFYSKRIDLFIVLTIVLSFCQMVLTGARGGIVGVALSAIYFYGINYYYVNRKFSEISLRFIVKAFMAVIVSAFVFYYGKGVVGRGSADITLSNMIPYLTMYAGGPIQLLDMFLIDPIESSSVFGKETFSGINIFLSRFGLVSFEPYIHHLEFRTAATGAFLGNVYTAYRSYIYDFGYVGLTLLPVIFSLSVHFMHYKMCYCRRRSVDWMILFYAFVFPCIFFDFARCMFFSSVVSIGTIKRFVFLMILARLLIKSDKDLIQ